MRGNDRHGSGSSRACNRYCPLKPLPPILSRLRTTGPEPEPTGVALGRLALQGPSRCQSTGISDTGHRHGLQSSERGRGRCKTRHGIRRLGGNQHMIQTRHGGEVHVCTID
jgi:hypothetical protein